jgi:hypothetical protein
MGLVGLVDLSVPLLAEAAQISALCKFLAHLSVFALQEGFFPSMGFAILLSIRTLTYTVHT